MTILFRALLLLSSQESRVCNYHISHYGIIPKAVAARPPGKSTRVTIYDNINKLPYNFIHSLANPFVRSIILAHLAIPYLLRLPNGIRL